MSELLLRALRNSLTFERRTADVAPPDRALSGYFDVQNPGPVSTKASDKTSNKASNTKKHSFS